MKPLVYIAGPYSSNPVWNTRAAIMHGLDLREKYQCAVIIPHLTLLADIVSPQPLKTWYDFDFDQLAHCHALIRLPGDSSGADAEWGFATLNGIPCFHIEEIAAIIEWRNQWQAQ